MAGHCLQDAERPEYQLKRVLGPFQLILFGIGAIIGAGIFATIGTAAAGDAYRPGAGPALMVSFVITAIVCSFTALCYAEFTSIVPISGSAYTYSYATLGEIVAWIIGWDLIIEYAVGNIAVAISWANYFKTFLAGFNIRVPDWLSMDYRTAAKIVDEAGVKVVYRDAPQLRERGLRCYVRHMKELMELARARGLRGLSMEVMSSSYEPPSSPEEISNFLREIHHGYRSLVF